MAPVPDLIVYTKPGCGLCREALDTLRILLAARAQAGQRVPDVVERDITADPAWERAFFDKIPVVDLGDRRLELVTGTMRLRRLLSDVLDAASSPSTSSPARPGG